MNNKKNCKHGFYTCAFIGNDEFCNHCEDGSNYQERTSNHGGTRPGAGRPKIPAELKKHRYEIYLQKHIMEGVGGKKQAVQIIEQHYNRVRKSEQTT